MLAAAFETGGKAQHLILVEPFGRLDRDHCGLALGERAGLVDDKRIDLLHALKRLGVLDQDTGLRAASDADHDRHRGGKAKRAGAGDDQHGDRRDQAIAHRRRRADQRPDDEGDRRDRDYRRHEPAGNGIGKPLDRRTAALGIGDHLDDPREHGVAADLLGAHHEAAGLVDRAADQL